jgi:hypothetical protein
MNFYFEYLKKFIFIVIYMLLPLFNVYSADNIVIYRMNTKDQATWSIIKKSFDSRGYNVSIYDATENMDRHLENLNRMNRSNALLALAMNFKTSDKPDVLVAAPEGEKGKGRFLTIDEVTANHEENSMILAKEVATSFGKNPKRFAIFPLLGVDMPGIFINIECKNDNINETLNKLHESIQKYLKRGN